MSEPLVYLSNDFEVSLFQYIRDASKKNDDQTVIDLTRKWCMKATSSYIQKTGMEFLYVNGLYDDLQKLINKNKGSHNTSNKQWATIYQLMFDLHLNRQTPLEIIQKVEMIDTDEPELICLILFIKIKANYRMKNFNELGNFLHEQRPLFEQIEDQFLISYFKIRIHQYMFIYYWTKNEVIMARKYAYRVLNEIINVKIKVNVHINLGLTYAFDTYTQAMYHLSQALTLSEKYNFDKHIHIIKHHNIPFIAAHFNRVDNIYTMDKSEQAHIEIAKGNNCIAIEILDSLTMDDPFNLYYMGVAKQDKHILFQSYNYFIEKRGDFFFSKLPLLALQKIEDISN